LNAGGFVAVRMTAFLQLSFIPKIFVQILAAAVAQNGDDDRVFLQLARQRSKDV
jgi:hypothetical protein